MGLTPLLIGLCVLIFAGLMELIDYTISRKKDMKLRREIFKPGNLVKLYHCLSKDFNDYEEYSSFKVCDVINDKAKIYYKDNEKDYIDLSYIGGAADMIEVYNKDEQFIGKYEHNYNTSVLYLGFLKKIE